MTPIETLTERYRTKQRELIIISGKEKTYAVSMWADQISQLKGECKGLMFAIEILKSAGEQELPLE